MARRIVEKHILLTPQEAADLKAKAQAACMPEAQLIRMLLTGYEPAPAPDENFYQVMDQVQKIYERIDILAGRISDPEVKDRFIGEADAWRSFQEKIENRFLRPKEVNLRWQ